LLGLYQPADPRNDMLTENFYTKNEGLACNTIMCQLNETKTDKLYANRLFIFKINRKVFILKIVLFQICIYQITPCLKI